MTRDGFTYILIFFSELSDFDDKKMGFLKTKFQRC